MKVLLSIKPEFADKIFNGTKKYEFRKSVFREHGVSTVVVYATRPVGKIVGEFDVSDVLCETPSDLWRITKKYSGITKDFFDEYFAGRDVSFALAVGDVRRFEPPLNPSEVLKNFTAPQSYMYIADDIGELKSDDQLELSL